MLGCLQEGYEKLAYLLEINSLPGLASEKVLKVIQDAKTPIAKADIEEILINLNRTTIEKALGELKKAGRILMIQSGKYAKYYKVD